MISQITAPLVTVAPTLAANPLMVPALWAVSGCSIFIASRTTTRSPSATVSPSATATFTMVPCIGLVSVSPEAAAGPCPARLWAGFFAFAGRSGDPGSEAGGQHDLEPLAADLDHDPLALAGVLLGTGAAGEGRDLVVELGLDPAVVHA